MNAHHILFVLANEKEKERRKERRERGRLGAIETCDSLDFAKYTIDTIAWIPTHT